MGLSWLKKIHLLSDALLFRAFNICLKIVSCQNWMLYVKALWLSVPIYGRKEAEYSLEWSEKSCWKSATLWLGPRSECWKVTTLCVLLQSQLAEQWPRPSDCSAGSSVSSLLKRHFSYFSSRLKGTFKWSCLCNSVPGSQSAGGVGGVRTLYNATRKNMVIDKQTKVHFLIFINERW